MSSSDEEEALLLLAIAEDEKPKKMWVCDINKERLQRLLPDVHPNFILLPNVLEVLVVEVI